MVTGLIGFILGFTLCSVLTMGTRAEIEEEYSKVLEELGISKLTNMALQEQLDEYQLKEKIEEMGGTND